MDLRKYQKPFLEDWYQTNGVVYFLLICLLYFATFLAKRMFIIDSIAAFEVLQERGEMWVFDLFFGLQYLSVPIFLAWKFTLTAFILWVGCFMFGYRVTFRDLWKMVMIMELIFILPELLKVLWFTLVETDPSFQEFNAFYPLCLGNLFDFNSLASQWHYPLKALNLFELIYWGLLVCGVFWLSNKKLKISGLIVLSSYILFFVLWLGYYIITYR